MAYTKLFNSIVTSTIWTEDDRTRIVWITMLALADKNGEVQASIPGLARIAGVPVADTESALERFLSPDPYSRTPDDEGRRIEKIEGGWALLNHAKYREMASREELRDAEAKRKARYRDRLSRKMSQNVPDSPGHVPQCPENPAQADTDTDSKAEAEAEACTGTPPGPETDLPSGSDEPPASKLAMRVVDCWNSFENLPKVQAVTKARQTALKARLREKFFLDNFEAAIGKISESDFCTGRVVGQNGWVATFDWLLRPDTAARVMEGKYDNRGGKKAGPTEFALSADEKPKVKTF